MKQGLYIGFAIILCVILVNIPHKFEITIKHHHEFDFGGNLYKPIVLQIKDSGYPIDINVNHKGSIK